MSGFSVDVSDSNILVTGAAGFIGFHLAKRLLENGCRVVGVDNLNEYYDPKLKRARLYTLQKHPNFTFSLLDLVDYDRLENIFSEEKPSIVVNLAAQAGVRYSIDHPREYIDSNIVGFFNVLEACRHYPVKHLVYASSSSVYGNQEKTPFSVEARRICPSVFMLQNWKGTSHFIPKLYFVHEIFRPMGIKEKTPKTVYISLMRIPENLNLVMDDEFANAFNLRRNPFEEK